MLRKSPSHRTIYTYFCDRRAYLLNPDLDLQHPPQVSFYVTRNTLYSSRADRAYLSRNRSLTSSQVSFYVTRNTPYSSRLTAPMEDACLRPIHYCRVLAQRWQLGVSRFSYSKIPFVCLGRFVKPVLTACGSVYFSG